MSAGSLQLCLDSNLTSNPLLSHDSYKFQKSVNAAIILKYEEMIFL